MTTPVSITLPATANNQLSIAQSMNPDQVQLLSSGEPFNGWVHSGNSITISEGPEVIRDPRKSEPSI